MIRILVVDDDSGQRLILKNRLGERGYEVAVADSGAKGLVEARGGAFDAILVAADLGSGIDGYEVCRRLKSIPETNTTPVVLFHSQTSAGDHVDRGYEAGCDAYVFGQELNGLDHSLKLLLRVRRQIRELAEQLQGLQELARRGGDRPRESRDSENGARDTAEHQNVLRELASGRPDGVLLVDGEGTVRHADRGACDLLGARLEGRHLGSLVPASGLEAFVRDARVDAREGFRFDANLRRGRAARSLTAVVLPFVVMSGEADTGSRVVLLYDAAKRRLAADLLRLPDRGVPRQELGALLDAAREVYRPEKLIGDTPPMRALRESVAAAMRASGHVLLVGAEGTGKERIARTLHFGGSSTGAFLHLRCSGISPADIDLELFGYVKGAFPGALSDRAGLFQLAQDGTLFLEEIGSLPLETQERLARFLDDGTVVRNGSRKAERIDLRIVASTSQSPDSLIAHGQLSRALMQRLDETLIHVPTLAECHDDVVPLALAAVERFGAARGVRDIADEALAVLRQHDWPGNVAELEDVIEQSCSRAREGVIRVEDLPRSLRERYTEPQRDLIPVRRPLGAQIGGTHVVGQQNHGHHGNAHGGHAAHGAHGPHGTANEPRPWDIADTEPVSLDLYEKKALLRALDQVGGDKLAAARLLKVGKSTLYRKLKRFGIH